MSRIARRQEAPLAGRGESLVSLLVPRPHGKALDAVWHSAHSVRLGHVAGLVTRLQSAALNAAPAEPTLLMPGRSAFSSVLLAGQAVLSTLSVTVPRVSVPGALGVLRV